MKRFLLGAALFSTLSIIPSTLNAQDRDRDDHREAQQRTYYDAHHRDRHEWNEREESAWNRYREERHIRQRDFTRENRRDQQRYWDWRHDHPDADDRR